jgi:hypothetical protein
VELIRCDLCTSKVVRVGGASVANLARLSLFPARIVFAAVYLHAIEVCYRPSWLFELLAPGSVLDLKRRSFGMSAWTLVVILVSYGLASELVLA